MKNYRLLGIHGKKRSGKDTAGRELLFIKNALRIQSPLIIDSFADPLRKFAFMTFGITEENREENIIGLDLTGRQLLQRLGTEVARNINENFWVESLKNRNSSKINEVTGFYENIIITDVRFDNEAKFIKENNGIILHVVRPSLESKDEHLSEKGIDPKYIDYTIINDSTEEDYKINIHKFYYDIFLR